MADDSLLTSVRKKHTIPDDCTNSEVLSLISEYVRLERDQQILRDHWFGGLTFEALAEKHYLSVTRIKEIVYKCGDKVLLKIHTK